MSDQVTRAKRTKHFSAAGGIALWVAMFVYAGNAPVWAQGDEIFPGQNMTLPDNDLIDAAAAGDIGAMRNALMRGIPADDGGIDYVPAIVVAANNGHLDAVLFLLSKGANPNRKARDGRTALSVAARNGNTGIASLLLDAKADPNLIADNGDSPLFIAVRSRRTAIVKLLIDHKVDLTDTDITGRTALDEAEERNFNDIAQLLRDAGA
ncbi:MAG: ankyrin repeat domain-containing protein [Pseudomonadota bacterium]